ncbi:NepR family anti-sigma factor [Sphingomonas sp. GCM10030256]|uniref:NepR family anti-sigma factor n=1 Tax=Sphingomonas sp. GCM10030256 TaxID=3273427 RepID=UPI00360BB7EC
MGGDERLSEGKRADSRRASSDKFEGSTAAIDKADVKPRRKRGDAPEDVSRALRSVYDETVQEDVPADFLDLLGKLV